VTQIAIKIKPLRTTFEELPARGKLDLKPGELTAIDLQWREAWIEAFLAHHPWAIPTCLGDTSKPISVYRQMADMDIVFVNQECHVATCVELKKQDGPNAKDTICQLARNFSKARRVLRKSFPKYSVRAIACGSWGEKQLQNARDTVAWKYLKEHKAKPSFVVYSGAVSGNKQEYFVLNDGILPFMKKGQAQPYPRFEKLQEQTQQTRERLLSGLDVTAYRIGEHAVVRFSADSRLRTSYLCSHPQDRQSTELNAFFRVRETLENRPAVVARFSIEQRLDLFLQPKAGKADITGEYAILHSALKQIQKLASSGRH